jgi:deoxyribodipyrimidine photolyase-related protein
MARTRGSTSAPRPACWAVLPDQLDLGGWRRRVLEARGQGEAAPSAVLVESREWLSRRPYHRQRVALIMLNLRAFADELRALGVDVDHRVVDGSMVDAFRAVADVRGPLRILEPAEREVRVELQPLIESGRLEAHANPHWMTTAADFAAARGSGGWRMDAFYRAVRARTGILMERGRPVGGKLSFDTENRKRWDGIPAAPDPPRFARTPLRDAVEADVAARFGSHPGRLDVEALPATHDDAESLWAWGRTACLPWFGPFEDAMSERSRGVFHTRVSPVLNLGRLDPRQLVADALSSGAPLASVEGFIRQVIGWREFVRHVHLATDGFRRVEGEAIATGGAPGDGGFARWSGRPWVPAAAPPAGIDGGAMPGAPVPGATPVPPAYWGATSGFRCLDHVVQGVWDEAWSHHITRLMVLGNLASLLDIDARELTDWFWIAYMDAWDWVVEPNVLGMATFAAGPVMTTKPYVAGSAYLDRMGDHCDACEFVPGRTCPFTRLYWAFLDRHAPRLAGNHRMSTVLGSLRRRSEAERAKDRAVFLHVRDVLVRGQRVRPEGVAAAEASSVTPSANNG